MSILKTLLFCIILFLSSSLGDVTIVEPSFNATTNPSLSNDTSRLNEIFRMPIVAAYERGEIRFNVNYVTKDAPTPNATFQVDPTEQAQWVSDIVSDQNITIVHSVASESNAIELYNALNVSNRTNIFLYNWVTPEGNSLRNSFNRQILELKPSISDELVALITFTAHELGLSRYTLITSSSKIPPVMEDILQSFGNKLQLYVVHSDENQPLDEDQLDNITNSYPQAVFFVSQPLISAKYIPQLKARLPEDTVYLMTSLTSYGISRENILIDLAIVHNMTVSNITKNLYSSNPFFTLDELLNPASIVGNLIMRDIMDSNYTQVDITDAQDGAYYLQGKWIANMLTSMTEEETLTTHAYNNPMSLLSGLVTGPILDDCSLSCCNTGIRKVRIQKYNQITAAEEELDDPYSFNWQTCRAKDSSPGIPLVFGQVIRSVDGNNTINYGEEIQKGLIAAFEESEMPLNLLTFVSDSENKTAEYARSLIYDYNVISLVGSSDFDTLLNTVLPISHDNMGNRNFSIIGTSSRVIQQDFTDTVLYISTSVRDQVAATIYSISATLGGRVYIFHSNSVVNRNAASICDDVLETYDIGNVVCSGTTEYEKDAFDPSIISTLDFDIGIFISGGSTQDTISLVSSPLSESMIFFIIGELSPETVMNSVNIDRDSVQFVSPLPALSTQYGIVADYITNYKNEHTTGSLEGYIMGHFIADLLSSVSGVVTQKKVADAAYQSSLFRAGELIFGPYSDKCMKTDEDGPCCNQGYRTVHFSTVNVSNSLYPYTFDTCGFRYIDDDAGDNGDDSSINTEAIIGSIAAVAAVLFSCLVLFMVTCFVVIVALVVVSLASAAGVFYLRRNDGFIILEELKEPDYYQIAFPEPVNMNQIDSDLNVALPFDKLKSIEEKIGIFESFMNDEKYTIPVNLALRAAAFDKYQLSFHLFNFYRYNESIMNVLDLLSRYELKTEYGSSDFYQGLMRQDSTMSQLFKRYTMVCGLPYLWHSMAHNLHKLRELTMTNRQKQAMRSTTSNSMDSGSIQLDLRKRKDKSKQAILINTYQLKLSATKIFAQLKSTPFPVSLKNLICTLAYISGEKNSRFTKENPDHRFTLDNPEVYATIVNCMFLRYICNAIVAPQQYGLMAEPPSSRMLRVCTLLSKMLQNLANQVRFKEEHMEKMNEFVESNMDGMSEWLEEFVKDTPLSEHKRNEIESDKPTSDSSTDSPTYIKQARNKDDSYQGDLEITRMHYDASLKWLLCMSLMNKDTFLNILSSNMTDKEFKKCRKEYLSKIGYYGMMTEKLLHYRIRKRNKKKKNVHEEEETTASEKSSEGFEITQSEGVGSDEEKIITRESNEHRSRRERPKKRKKIGKQKSVE